MRAGKSERKDLGFSDDKWREFASCKIKGYPLNWFFNDYDEDIEIQLKVDELCRNCVVRTQCEDYAISVGAEGGVFGRKYFPQSIKRKNRRRKEGVDQRVDSSPN